MTREEAIKLIEYIAHDFFINDKGCEALDMAIKALEQEPCDERRKNNENNRKD